jgi:hypothetical protein
VLPENWLESRELGVHEASDLSEAELDTSGG